MFRELITFRFESRVQHVDVVCRQNVEFIIYVTECGTYNYHWDVFARETYSLQNCLTRGVTVLLPAASFEVHRQTQTAWITCTVSNCVHKYITYFTFLWPVFREDPSVLQDCSRCASCSSRHCMNYEYLNLCYSCWRVTQSDACYNARILYAPDGLRVPSVVVPFILLPNPAERGKQRENTEPLCRQVTSRTACEYWHSVSCSSF